MLLAVARLLGNLLRLPFFPMWWLARLFLRPRGAFIHVRLRHRLVELPGPRPFFLRFVPELARVLPTPLTALRRLADRAGDDPAVRGVLLEIPPLAAGWSACAGVREVVGLLRARGKTVVAYLPEGGGNKEVWVASSADRVIVGTQATLFVLGLSIEVRYLKPLLDKLGIGVRPIAQGEYKSAAENLSRESMSDAQREQLGALLDTLDGELVSGLASLPGLDEERVRAIFERGFLRGAEAVDAGLATDACYEDELPTQLSTDGEPVKLVGAARYLAFSDARFFSRVVPRPYVAVVEVHGPIVQRQPGFGGRRIADAESLVSVLRTLRRDRFAAGVVLHVDSPGGSALASDMIHREVVRLKEKKPVVACFGDVAASGGYYIAAPAHAIVAQPVTITGSIGVVTAKVVASELLDAIGVRTEVLRKAPHADMFSVARELSEEEHDIVDRETAGFYRVFVELVAEGRGRTAEEIQEIARGRVWSGADARARGLVDRLGGLAEAVDEVRSRTGLPPAVARRLLPRRARARRLDVPAPEPPAAAALGPEFSALWALLSSDERVLLWAPVPRIA